MSARNSPDPASQLVVSGDEGSDARIVANGHRSPDATGEQKGQASPEPSIEGDAGTLPDASPKEKNDGPGTTNGGDDDANSEAETLIDSPVKKKEAEKQRNVVRTEKPQKSRIGSLPVPGDDDEDGDSTASALESREVSVGNGTPVGDGKEDVEMMDDDSDKENGSELSSARSSASNVNSRASSRSRALSERPPDARNGAGSPNPRKRKHRASSMSLPSSKRQSMDPPKRTRLRGLHSEDTGGRVKESLSPKRGHRRAVSTQSALDGTAEGGGRKRKVASTYPGQEPKSAKGSWEESDASSETTSRGQDESKRPQRGIGRSTSTPGRPGAREHKRHVNKYGFTRLAEACEDANLELIRELLEKDPEAIEVPEFAGNRPLQIAALNGNAEVVTILIDHGCQIDCANGDKDTPLIDAAENGHLEVIKLLLAAGVDPLRQNLKGQQALDVVTDENEDSPGIRAALHKAIDTWNSSEAKQRREEEEEQRHRAGPSKELHLMARTYENLLKLVQNNDRNGVSEFLAARVPVDNNVIAAAAKTGDLYLVNMLLAEMTDKKARQKPEKPMLSVLGTSHFEMVKALTELENFNPLWRDRAGKSWPDLVEERSGSMWRQERELLQRLYDSHVGSKDRRSSSPVVKRDGATRRYQQADAEDESEEEEGTRQRKRKNGRRLMSKKAMRAVGGKGTSSESSEEEDDGEPNETPPAINTAAAPVKDEAEAEMKPPETPNTRRRLRSKSISSPSEISPKSLRKRSNSTRDVAEKALPTLHEKVEEKDSGSDGIVLGGGGDDKAKKNNGDKAKLALDEAKRLDEKRKQEEEAEAEAKRVEEQLRKQEEERKAEEERKVAEERAAEEARRREEEAEQARKAKEESLRREREMKKAKKKFQSQLLDRLPTPFNYVLDPDSGFRYESEADKNLLLRQFTPLLALGSPQTPGSNVYVLNLQAAPLLGKIGLEAFQALDSLVTSSLLDHWTTEPLEEADFKTIDQILARLSWDPAPAFPDGDEEMQDVETSFEDELKKTAERYEAFVTARRMLQDVVYKFGFRRLKLVDVLNNLHPLLKDSAIDVEFVPAQPMEVERAVKGDMTGKEDFVQGLKKIWETDGSRPPTSVLYGKLDVPAGNLCASLTDVVVVNEKRP